MKNKSLYTLTSEFQKRNSDSPLVSNETKRGGQDSHPFRCDPRASFAKQSYGARRRPLWGREDSARALYHNGTGRAQASAYLVMLLLISFAVYPQENVSAAVRNPFVPQLPLPPEAPKEDSGKKVPVKTPDKERSAAIVEQKDLPALKITGLVWNSKRPQAIINGQVVSVGETIGDVKIVSIRPDGVDVLFNDKIITVTP